MIVLLYSCLVDCSQTSCCCANRCTAAVAAAVSVEPRLRVGFCPWLG